MADEADEDREQLKAALWYAIGKITDEESMKKNRNASPQYIGALTELVLAQIENVAGDLESFSRHAGRTRITTDDVLLLTRKNEDLCEIMKDFLNKRKARKARQHRPKRQ